MSWSRMLNPIKVIGNIKRKLLLYIARQGVFIEPKKNKVLCIFFKADQPLNILYEISENNLSLNDQFKKIHNIEKVVRMHMY